MRSERDGATFWEENSGRKKDKTRNRKDRGKSPTIANNTAGKPSKGEGAQTESDLPNTIEQKVNLNEHRSEADVKENSMFGAGTRHSEGAMPTPERTSVGI